MEPKNLENEFEIVTDARASFNVGKHNETRKLLPNEF